jgi:hypothetical protein
VSPTVGKLVTIRPEVVSRTTSLGGESAPDEKPFVGVIQSHWIVCELTSWSPFGDSRTFLRVNNGDSELFRDIDVNSISVLLELE